MLVACRTRARREPRGKRVATISRTLIVYSRALSRSGLGTVRLTLLSWSYIMGAYARIARWRTARNAGGPSYTPTRSSSTTSRVARTRTASGVAES